MRIIPMIFGQTVQDTRQQFFLSFGKYQQGQPLSALEQQLVQVILDHPEYHTLLSSPSHEANYRYQSDQGQENPFLHMGLHLALRDQVQLDKPMGIQAVYQSLVLKHGDRLYVEHVMMEPLALCVWEAQRDQKLPDEASYLNACRELL